MTGKVKWSRIRKKTVRAAAPMPVPIAMLRTCDRQVGADVSLEEAQEAAKVIAINILATLKGRASII